VIDRSRRSPGRFALSDDVHNYTPSFRLAPSSCASSSSLDRTTIWNGIIKYPTASPYPMNANFMLGESHVLFFHEIFTVFLFVAFI
jgi:hypothetical protein